MKPTDFASRLQSFLVEFLPGQRNVSEHTVKTYAHAFRLVLLYFQRDHRVPPERLTLDHLTVDNILAFLNWLETERSNSIGTRNLRLAGIHSFFRYLQHVSPERIEQCQRVLSISTKRGPTNLAVNHLRPEVMKQLLALPDRRTRRGMRDAALMSLLYDGGLRVHELCILTPAHLRCEPPCHVEILGKGRKRRLVPLLPATMALLCSYMSDHGLGGEDRRDAPLFFNNQGTLLTRAGVRHIIVKYASRLNGIAKGIHVSPHTFRHSKAMHLLQSGNPLAVIQSILGHANVATTGRYARADMDMMRAAIDKAPRVTPATSKGTKWSKPDLLEWLRQL
jgi:site-specific recombinase XerD